MAVSRLPATRLANVAPKQVTTGRPAHSASLAVVVRVVIKSVEEKVGQPLTRQVLLSPDMGSKYQPLGCNPAQPRFPAQIVRKHWNSLDQPQNAALCLAGAGASRHRTRQVCDL